MRLPIYLLFSLLVPGLAWAQAAGGYESMVLGPPITAANSVSWAKCPVGTILVSGGFNDAPPTMSLPGPQDSQPANDKDNRQGWRVTTHSAGPAYAVCSTSTQQARAAQRSQAKAQGSRQVAGVKTTPTNNGRKRQTATTIGQATAGGRTKNSPSQP